jgi:hypothetical protein
VTAGLVDSVPVAWLEELVEHFDHEHDYFLREGEAETAAQWYEKADNVRRFLDRHAPSGAPGSTPEDRLNERLELLADSIRAYPGKGSASSRPRKGGA